MAKIAHRPPAELNAPVFGAGSVGPFAALSLKDHGVGRIDLTESNALRRETANNAGLGRVIDPLTGAPGESAFDLIIDALGVQATRKAAIAEVLPGGAVMNIGLMDNEGGFDAR